MRHAIATGLCLIGLIGVSIVGGLLMCLDQYKTSLLGSDKYWSERKDSPVRDMSTITDR